MDNIIILLIYCCETRDKSIEAKETTTKKCYVIIMSLICIEITPDKIFNGSDNATLIFVQLAGKIMT